MSSTKPTLGLLWFPHYSAAFLRIANVNLSLDFFEISFNL